MPDAAIRNAAPTAQPPAKDGAGSEGRHDSHGITWIRGAPPLDCNTYAAGTFDVVTESVARHSDSLGNGTGTGRRASGFLLLGGGTVSITTGSGATNAFAGASLPAGFGVTCEFTSITHTDGTGCVVFW